MSEQDSRPRPAGVHRGAAGAALQPTRAVAYVRVSTEKQADLGVSLEAQQAKLSQYAQLYDLELVETVVDAGLSASSLDRPGLQRALGMLATGAAEALLVMKLDRLTRSVRDIGALIDGYFGPGGAALLVVDQQIDTRSAAGRMVLNVMVTMAQWEREVGGERTSAAMRHMAANGQYTGGAPPYGFRVAGERVEPEPGEQATIAAARALRSAGLSLRKVAAALEKHGLKSRTGRPFGATQIAAMVAKD